jgi:anti-sigma B factor antagonist
MQDVLYPSSSVLVAGDENADGSVFAVLVEHQTNRIVVSVHGELDVASAPVLQRQLLALLKLPIACVALDLRELDFMDSTGLSVLVRVHRAAQESEVDFELVEASEPIEWMLSLTGLAPLAAPTR